MITELKPVFVETMPDTMVDGEIYVSVKYGVSIHLCICGCKNKIVLPFNSKGDGYNWKYERSGDNVSFSPSVGNWQLPCKTHYFIKNNKIIQA